MKKKGSNKVYIKKRTKKEKNKKNKNRNKTKRNKIKSTNLIYFYMKNCGYCDEFSKTLWPQVKELKNIKTFKINGPENELLTEKFNIESYPTLVKLDNKSYEIFQGERTFENIKKFIN